MGSIHVERLKQERIKALWILWCSILGTIGAGIFLLLLQLHLQATR